MLRGYGCRRVTRPGAPYAENLMRRLASMICCVVMLVGCAVDPGVSASDAEHSDATFDPNDDPFGWTRFGGPGVEIGTFTAPVDYNDPSKGKMELNIARHLAEVPSERIGSLLVNPGGPGFGGTDFALFAEQNFGQKLLDHFDIVAWDPRGTGFSEPAIDCIDDYDHFYATGDITPDDSAERQQLIDLAREFTTDCIEKNADFYQYVGTNNSARDMDAIRAALGEATISYLGFSYGSELGATWATLFPSTVRAAVFDGAVDPRADATDSGLQQLKGFEDSLTAFFASCSADAKCPFNNDGDAAGAFDRLMQSVDESPVPTVDGRPPVTQEVALSAVGQAMYSQTTWPQLALALSDAQNGDGKGLLKLYDQYYVRRDDGTYANALEAFRVISCMDTTERLTVEEDDAEVPRAQAVAPRFAISTVGDYACTFFPPSIDPRIEITGAGAGPIVVVGTTGDPATPLEGTRKMAESLEQGRLVTVVGNQHTGYGLNACSTAAVEDYLIDPAGHLPVKGLRCE
jgi:pimeloyl-ACP methyl ester carboxylesterase